MGFLNKFRRKKNNANNASKTKTKKKVMSWLRRKPNKAQQSNNKAQQSMVKIVNVGGGKVIMRPKTISQKPTAQRAFTPPTKPLNTSGTFQGVPNKPYTPGQMPQWYTNRYGTDRELEKLHWEPRTPSLPKPNSPNSWHEPKNLSPQQIQKIARFLRIQYHKGLTSIDQARNHFNRVVRSNSPYKDQNVQNAWIHKTQVEAATEKILRQLKQLEGEHLQLNALRGPYKVLVTSQGGKNKLKVEYVNQDGYAALHKGWREREKNLGSATPLPASTVLHGLQLAKYIPSSFKNAMYLNQIDKELRSNPSFMNKAGESRSYNVQALIAARLIIDHQADPFEHQMRALGKAYNLISRKPPGKLAGWEKTILAAGNKLRRQLVKKATIERMVPNSNNAKETHDMMHSYMRSFPYNTSMQALHKDFINKLRALGGPYKAIANANNKTSVAGGWRGTKGNTVNRLTELRRSQFPWMNIANGLRSPKLNN